MRQLVYLYHCDRWSEDRWTGHNLASLLLWRCVARHCSCHHFQPSLSQPHRLAHHYPEQLPLKYKNTKSHENLQFGGHNSKSISNLWHRTKGETERMINRSVTYSECSWQGFVTTPVLWQDATKEVWAVSVH